MQISLTVDGSTYPETWKVTGRIEMLGSSKAFLGGSEAPYKMPGHTGASNNFVGCIRKVTEILRNFFRFIIKFV